MSISADTPPPDTNIPISASIWYKGALEVHQRVDQNNYLYGSESISKIMRGTEGSGGAEYVGRIFKNLGDALHVKCARFLHRILKGEWVNNQTIRTDLTNKVKELTALVNERKKTPLSDEDQGLVDKGIDEMRTVLSVLQTRQVKDLGTILNELNNLDLRKTFTNPESATNLPIEQLQKPAPVTTTEPPLLQKLDRTNIHECEFGPVPDTIIDQLLDYLNSRIEEENKRKREENAKKAQENSNSIESSSKIDEPRSSIRRIVLYRPVGRMQPDLLEPMLTKSSHPLLKKNLDPRFKDTPTDETFLIFLHHMNVPYSGNVEDRISKNCRAYCHLYFWMDTFNPPVDKVAISPPMNRIVVSYDNLDAFFNALFAPPAKPSASNVELK